MKTVRWFGAVVAVAVLAPAAPAQEGPKPGPEHAVLKKLEGNWDLVMKFGGMESKGAVTYKMELGGLWLAGSLESELFGAKFQGKSLDSYDAGKKKYISVWIDSMGTQPMILEGTYDAGKKTLTFRRRPRHGRQADQVQVGQHVHGRQHHQLRHVHRRRERAVVHDRLHAQEEVTLAWIVLGV